MGGMHEFMYNVRRDGMNFKDEKQARNRMKIMIICMCGSDDDDVEGVMIMDKQVVRCGGVRKYNSEKV